MAPFRRLVPVTSKALAQVKDGLNTWTMSADEHFNEHGVIPPALDDFEPDDLPAARSIGIAILALLCLSLLVTTIIYGRSAATTGAAAAEVEDVRSGP